MPQDGRSRSPLATPAAKAAALKAAAAASAKASTAAPGTPQQQLLQRPGQQQQQQLQQQQQQQLAEQATEGGDPQLAAELAAAATDTAVATAVDTETATAAATASQEQLALQQQAEAAAAQLLAQQGAQRQQLEACATAVQTPEQQQLLMQHAAAQQAEFQRQQQALQQELEQALQAQAQAAQAAQLQQQQLAAAQQSQPGSQPTGQPQPQGQQRALSTAEVEQLHNAHYERASRHEAALESMGVQLQRVSEQASWAVDQHIAQQRELASKQIVYKFVEGVSKRACRNRLYNWLEENWFEASVQCRGRDWVCEFPDSEMKEAALSRTRQCPPRGASGRPQTPRFLRDQTQPLKCGMEVWTTDKANLPRNVFRPAWAAGAVDFAHEELGTGRALLLRYRSPTQAVLWVALAGAELDAFKRRLFGAVATLGTREPGRAAEPQGDARHASWWSSSAGGPKNEVLRAGLHRRCHHATHCGDARIPGAGLGRGGHEGQEGQRQGQGGGQGQGLHCARRGHC